MLAVRVVPTGPLEAQVHAERPGGAWRPVLITRGPDALARAQDLGRLLEVGLLAIAADAPPRLVSPDEHPEPWISLADAVRALRESPAATVARIERGELRTLDTERGLYVRVEDLLDVARHVRRLDVAAHEASA